MVHVFPADGDYVVKTALHYAALGGLFGRTPLLAMGFKEQVEVSVDGERVAVLDVSPTMTETDFGQNKGQNGMELRTPSIHIKAGPHRVTAAFLQRLDGPVDDLMAPIDNTAESGDGYGSTTLPAHARHDDSRSHQRHRRVRDREPAPRVHVPSRDGGSGRSVRGADRQGTRRAGVPRQEHGARRAGRDAVLRAGPQGRRLRERHADGAAVDTRQPAVPLPAGGRRASAGATGLARITDHDLAARLSFFLWGTGPDAELVAAAGAGGLQTRAGLEAQVRRLLADRRSEALSSRFASQWLRLQDLDQLHPEFTAYPQFDESLRDAMRRETLLFFDSIVREDRNVLDLLTADYSFVNERLARHYGIANVNGERVPPGDAARLSPRPARPGQHPDAHVGGRSHLAGVARQVGDGSAAWAPRRHRRRPTCPRSTSR